MLIHFRRALRPSQFRFRFTDNQASCDLRAGKSFLRVRAMRLNLGCGFNKREGFVNVDIGGHCAPDRVHDLEQVPWPWDDSSVGEIFMSHVLDHLGATTAQYFAVLREMYRVSRHDAGSRSSCRIRAMTIFRTMRPCPRGNRDDVADMTVGYPKFFDSAFIACRSGGRGSRVSRKCANLCWSLPNAEPLRLFRQTSRRAGDARLLRYTR
jgi:hypothetical protein